MSETYIPLSRSTISVPLVRNRKKLIEMLSALGFTHILIHGKSNYVMEIEGETAKLSAHKQTVKLLSNQWGLGLTHDALLCHNLLDCDTRTLCFPKNFI